AAIDARFEAILDAVGAMRRNTDVDVRSEAPFRAVVGAAAHGESGLKALRGLVAVAFADRATLGWVGAVAEVVGTVDAGGLGQRLVNLADVAILVVERIAIARQTASTQNWAGRQQHKKGEARCACSSLHHVSFPRREQL